MGTKNYKTYLSNRTTLSTGVSTYAALNEAGTIVGQGVVGMIIPDDFGDVHTADDTAAVSLAFARAVAVGAPLVLPRGVYTISEKLVIPSDAHIIIMAGATLKAHASFSDDVLIEVGDETDIAQFWSITGAGTLDCNNDIDYGIRVVKGRFGLISVKEIHGANEKAVLIGTAVDTFNSYEIDVVDVRAYYNDVANTATSIAFHAKQATDCHFITCYSIGYRKGFRTENSAIDLDGCHVWGRLAHGPLTHCFDIQGSQNKVINCYADTPHNKKPDGTSDGTITDVYGFYIHGFNNILDGSLIYMNTTLQTDGVVNCIYEDRDTFSDFGSLTIFGGVAVTSRFKTAFVPFSGSHSTIRVNKNPGSTYFSASPAGLTTYRSYTGENVIDNGTRNFTVRSVHAGITTNAEARVTGAAATARRVSWQTSDVDRVKAGLNTTAESGSNAGSDWTLDMYSDAGAFLVTAATVTRANGNFTIGRPALTLQTTAANIAAKANAINTTGKINGLLVWDTTNNRLMRASGSTDTDAWWVVDGSASVTPA